MSRRKTILLSTCAAALVIILVGVFIASLQNREPIRIGLATTLSAKGATSGTHSRNGALLAVEKINSSGGINGRPVELVVRDDQGRIEEALRVDRELIDSGVVAILGHFSSSLAVATVPLMNEKNMLMVGLGTITDVLSNRDDNFMRVAMALDIRIPVLAEVVRRKYNLENMVVVYDQANPMFSEPCYLTFKESFETLGGRIVKTLPYNSEDNSSLAKIGDEVAGTKADGLLLITRAIHGALLTQHIRNRGSDIKIIDSGWGISDPEFIIHGGRAIDGVISVHQFNDESSSEQFRQFTKDYQNRFGDVFGNTAQRGFEAASLILYALTKTDDPQEFKAAILQKGHFDGVDGTMFINKYGDAIRSLYLLEVQGHKIRTVEKIDSDKFRPPL